MKWKKRALELEENAKSLDSMVAGRDSLLQEALVSVSMYSTAWSIMKRVREAAAQNMNFIPYRQWVLEFKRSGSDEPFTHGYTHGQEEILSMLMCDIRNICRELGYDFEDANGCLLKTAGCNKNLLYFQDALSRSQFNGKLTPEDTLIVSSWRPDNRYSTKYIKAEIKQIVDVICEDDYDKLFCSSDDYAVFCTEGKRLHSCVAGLNEQFIAELTKALSVPEDMVMGKTGSGMSFEDKCLLSKDKDEKRKKLEDLKKSRCVKCSSTGNSEDMWCWNLPWCHCDVKSLREELEGKCKNPLSAKEYIDTLLEKHNLDASGNFT